MAMSFSPTGLQAVQTITAASWSGQTQTFGIGSVQNGSYVPYLENLYNGDPVILSEGGLSSPAFGTTGAAITTDVNPIGVFLSCSYESPPNTNTGFNTTSTGSPMYMAGTTSYKDLLIPGQIISDPHVVYTVLVAGGTTTQPDALTAQQKMALLGSAGGLGYISFVLNTGACGPATGHGSVAGNNTTGMSKAFMAFQDITMPGQAVTLIPGAAYVRILGVNTNPSLNTSLYDDYLYMDVMLANHLYNTPVVTGEIE